MELGLRVTVHPVTTQAVCYLAEIIEDSDFDLLSHQPTMSSFTYQFDTPTYKGTSTVPTGLFINGKFVEPLQKGTIEYVLASIVFKFHLMNLILTRVLNPGRSINCSCLISFDSEYSQWKGHNLGRRWHCCRYRHRRSGCKEGLQRALGLEGPWCAKRQNAQQTCRPPPS